MGGSLDAWWGGLPLPSRVACAWVADLLPAPGERVSLELVAGQWTWRGELPFGFLDLLAALRALEDEGVLGRAPDGAVELRADGVWRWLRAHPEVRDGIPLATPPPPRTVAPRTRALPLLGAGAVGAAGTLLLMLALLPPGRPAPRAIRAEAAVAAAAGAPPRRPLEEPPPAIEVWTAQPLTLGTDEPRFKLWDSGLRRVKLSRFAIDARPAPVDAPGEGGGLGVTWEQARAHCQRSGCGGRPGCDLPTEAQWEAAAQQGYLAWLANGRTPPPHRFCEAPETAGLRGLLCESAWTLDAYGPVDPSPRLVTDPVRDGASPYKVVRGGQPGAMVPHPAFRMGMPARQPARVAVRCVAPVADDAPLAPPLAALGTAELRPWHPYRVAIASTVTPEAGTVPGLELSPILRRHRPALERCWERGALREERGQLQVVLGVEAQSGRVREVEALADSLRSQSVRACVLEVLERVRFGKVGPRGVVRLALAMHLRVY